MAAFRASTSWPRARIVPAFARVSPGPLLLAASLPFIFLHIRYQPDLGRSVGGAHVDVRLSDLAVLGVALTAFAAAARCGVEPLRRGRPVWITSGVFLAIALVSVSYPVLRDEPYDWRAGLVSALKFCEYAALAFAVPLLIRGRHEGRIPLRALVGWGTVATCVGILQFLGWVNEFEGRRPAQREPSLLGIHDFAALSGGVLVLGFLTFALQDDELIGRSWAILALPVGGLGIVLSGALTSVIGIWLALAMLMLVARQRGRLTPKSATLLAVVAIIVTIGTAGMRGNQLRDFAAFIGIHRNETPGAIESYAQRTVLGYIGLKIFLAEPLTGVGYQGSNDVWAYGPHLAAAHRRFPNQPAIGFPSPAHPWGVQNFYIESLADLGVIGGAALCALFATALIVGLRGAAASPLPLVGVAWVLVTAGVWIGLGIVPGIPLAGLTWLGLGLVTVRE